MQAIGTSSTMVKINQETITYSLVPLPPLSEQKRIVEKVDELMKLCDQLEEQTKQGQKNAGVLMDVVLKESFN